MKTHYRDENNKLQRCEIEETFKYHHIGEHLFFNGKAFKVTKIEIKEKEFRVVSLERLVKEKSYLDYKVFGRKTYL